MPWRRATSETMAPGASVSFTMRALSSCNQRRRRCTLPRTSTASPDLKVGTLLQITVFSRRPTPATPDGYAQLRIGQHQKNFHQCCGKKDANDAGKILHIESKGASSNLPLSC
jgi:hypothetical protein